MSENVYWKILNTLHLDMVHSCSDNYWGHNINCLWDNLPISYKRNLCFINTWECEINFPSSQALISGFRTFLLSVLNHSYNCGRSELHAYTLASPALYKWSISHDFACVWWFTLRQGLHDNRSVLTTIVVRINMTDSEAHLWSEASFRWTYSNFWDIILICWCIW